MENRTIIFILAALVVFLFWKNNEQNEDIKYLKETVYMQNEAILSQGKLLSVYKFYYNNDNPIFYKNNDTQRTH